MIYYPVFGQRPSFHGGSHDDYLRDTVSAYKATVPCEQSILKL